MAVVWQLHASYMRVTCERKDIMNEKLIERKLREAVSQMGGEAIKFYSAYNTGVPDRLVLMPGGKVSFVELKSTGKKPTKLQSACHAKLRKLGFEVSVIDTQTGLDEYLQGLKGGGR